MFRRILQSWRVLSSTSNYTNNDTTHIRDNHLHTRSFAKHMRVLCLPIKHGFNPESITYVVP